MSPHLKEAFGKLALRFEANAGQVDPAVRFISRGAGYTLFLTPDGMVTRLQRFSHGSRRGQVQAVDSAQITTRFEGANPKVRVDGREPQSGTINHLIGADPSQWRTGVPTYGQVRYSGIYPGIDLVFYGNQGQVEYDFIVAPGADPGQIALAITGAESISVDESGALLMKVAGGQLIQRAPVVYELQHGLKTPVEGRYRLVGGDRVTFEVGKRSPGSTLVIDPILSYSTYVGGSGDDFPYWSDIDEQGNLFISGFTSSLDYPTSHGAVQTTRGGGTFDAFVTKLNRDGSGIVYSTLIGGRGDDIATGMSVAGDGRVYVTGFTSSSDFPTRNAIQRHHAGGPNDGFVVGLSPDGRRFIYSTYLGGSGDDQPFICPAHPDGTIWVLGFTSSTDFPVTAGAFQGVNAGGYDAFATKLDPLGRRIQYSTYVGGSGNDFGIDGTVDSEGEALMTGSTGSTDFPATPGAFQTRFGGGNSDAFVVRIARDGASLRYGTYLGGAGDDDVRDGRFDRHGNAYVPGLTSSPDFPTTPGAFQTVYGGGALDGYVAVLSPDGKRLCYGTYFGGSGFDFVGDVVVGPRGDVFFTGTTGSLDLPTTADAFQPSFAGGNSDVFVGHLRLADSRLLYASYIGGSGDEESNGQGLSLDSRGGLYVVGDTSSPDLPTTHRAFQSGNQGSRDGFAQKLSFPSR